VIDTRIKMLDVVHVLDKDQYPEDTDYRSIPPRADEEEENKQRKERHR